MTSRPNMKSALQAAAAPPSQKIAPIREGKCQIAGFWPPEVRHQLHQVALDRHTTIQALLSEGINYIFRNAEKPPIA